MLSFGTAYVFALGVAGFAGKFLESSEISEKSLSTKYSSSPNFAGEFGCPQTLPFGDKQLLLYCSVLMSSGLSHFLPSIQTSPLSIVIVSPGSPINRESLNCDGS